MTSPLRRKRQTTAPNTPEAKAIKRATPHSIATRLLVFSSFTLSLACAPTAVHATDWSPRSRPLPRSEAKPTIVKSSNDGWESRDNGQVSPRTARQIRPASSRQDTVPQSVLDNPFDDRETEKNGAKRNRDERNRTTAEEAGTTTSRFPNRSQSSARQIGQTRDTAFRFVDGRTSRPAERLEFPASQMIVLESKTSTEPI